MSCGVRVATIRESNVPIKSPDQKIERGKKSKASAWAEKAAILSSIKRICRKPIVIRQKKNDKQRADTKSRFMQGWREIGEKRIFFRSKWEANYGQYLEWLKQRKVIVEWEHEPKTFWFEGVKRGCVSYLPDFRVTYPDGRVEWIEVKGHMDAKSKTKIKRFQKYFPEETLRVIGSAWYKENNSKMSVIIPNWERR